MRKRIVFVAFAAAALAGVAGSAAPAPANAGLPVEVRRECGGYNVYVFGTPLYNNVWCPDYPPA